MWTCEPLPRAKPAEALSVYMVKSLGGVPWQSLFVVQYHKRLRRQVVSSPLQNCLPPPWNAWKALVVWDGILNLQKVRKCGPGERLYRKFGMSFDSDRRSVVSHVVFVRRRIGADCFGNRVSCSPRVSPVSNYSDHTDPTGIATSYASDSVMHSSFDCPRDTTYFQLKVPIPRLHRNPQLLWDRMTRRCLTTSIAPYGALSALPHAAPFWRRWLVATWLHWSSQLSQQSMFSKFSLYPRFLRGRTAYLSLDFIASFHRVIVTVLNPCTARPSPCGRGFTTSWLHMMHIFKFPLKFPLCPCPCPCPKSM